MKWFFGSLIGLAVAMIDPTSSVLAAEPGTMEMSKVSAGITNPFQNWQADKFRDHPLVGKIWSRQTGGTVAV